jgi:putative ABC transport system permease protein
MEKLRQDVGLALRGLVKRPAATLLMVATLGGALAANAAVFSMIDAIIVRPLSFEAPDTLVLIGEKVADERFSGGPNSVAPADFLDWRSGTDAFSGLAAAVYWNASLLGPERPERIQGVRVSPGFFEILSTAPALGRGFLKDEEVPGRGRVVVLGYALWARQYGADRSVLGTSVVLDGEPHTVVGIAPQGFDFPMGAEVWAPYAPDAGEVAEREHRWLTVVGRLAPGRTLEQARAQVEGVDQRLHAEHPELLRGRSARLVTLAEGIRDEGVGPFFAVLQLAALLVLLVACVNVANLMLARGTERQRELTLRQALGAPRRRLVRQLVTESAVVALLAAAASLPLSWAATDLLRSSLPASIARFVAGWRELDVDGRTVAFTTLAALGAVLFFGMLPALVTTRSKLALVLREGGRSATAGGRRQRGRNLLVVAEIGVALSLLVASVLSTRSALRMLDGPQGYDPRGLLTAQVSLPSSRYPEPDDQRRFARALLEETRHLPGARLSALTNALPSSNQNYRTSLEVEGEEYRGPGKGARADWRPVTPEYFDTLKLPLLEGRAFDAGDDEGSRRVAIVSRSLAERHWPGMDPLGRRLRSSGDDEWMTVVGVCGDVIHHWFGARNVPTLYAPLAQHPRAELSVAVRIEHGDPEALDAELRRAVAAVDPEQPVFRLRSQRRAIAETTIGLRLVASIMGAFAVIGLALAASGVYAVMAFRVSQRTQEIAIRVAMGASQRQVVALTLAQAARLTAAGIALGLGLAMALARVMAGAFVGVLSIDPVAFAVVAAALTLVALLAGYVPARRALAVDPTVALRAE